MDLFIEKIVKRRKSPADIAVIILILIAALAASFFAFVFLGQLAMFIVLGILYLAYFLISKTNVEFEYAVTNGDLDIDTIINQRKRKRLFSANCKDFEIVARVGSSHYTREYKECKNLKDYSSRSNNGEVWFISLRKDGGQTVILFEPSPQMIDSFATFIPRKVFKN